MDREQRGRKKGEERRLRWDKGSTSTGRWNSRLRESSAGQLTAQAKDLFRLAACEQQKASRLTCEHLATRYIIVNCQ